MPGETIKSVAQGLVGTLGSALESHGGAVETVGGELRRPERLIRPPRSSPSVSPSTPLASHPPREIALH